jgi:hypothetical protein
MYKEKYLKYKTKYLELKNQLDGISNTIQEGGSWSWLWSTQDKPNINISNNSEYKELRIEDTINNIILSIKYNVGEISVKNSKSKFMNTIYKFNLNSNDNPNLNIKGTTWLSESDNTVKPIYKKFIQIAIVELENITSEITEAKKNCISQLNHYIKLLN